MESYLSWYKLNPYSQSYKYIWMIRLPHWNKSLHFGKEIPHMAELNGNEIENELSEN